ncbi:unnamed protein product [Gulo gulo]|uniref:Uncharacterized protein n=1 Tax=Gulo gulo TaxID=48420 RepID=A0A9X9M1V5_GULGU|nr:unnamed protein product [Gulo gulo]
MFNFSSYFIFFISSISLICPLCSITCDMAYFML